MKAALRMPRMTRMTLNLGWLALMMLPVGGCGATPQLGGNEASFTAVDALWTAISAKSSDLLAASAAELRRLNQAGQLPDEPYRALVNIVDTARRGDWAAARSALKRFIKEQKRS